MWHASVSRGLKEERPLIALRVLLHAGDPALGEWREWGQHGVLHLRRRLTALEAAPIGEVIDVRQSAEGYARFVAMRPFLPAHWKRIV